VVKDFRSVPASPALAVATLLGAGFFPVLPGTVGSALALPLVLILQPLGDLAKGAIFLMLFVICVWAANRAGQQLRQPDHPAIICDETWGMAVVWEFTPADWRWMVASFVAFRLFDALKPWPISTIDREMKNGLGVMLDDGLAAIAAILSVLAVAAAAARWV
jgi:phosphatidylglycerophosphatase A